MSALVTASDSPKALSVIRSLGRAGIPVTAAAERLTSLGASSKYCTGAFTYPSPHRSPEGFIRELSAFIRSHPHDVLIPVHSEDTCLIAKYRESLRNHITIPIHSYEIIREVNDKMRLMQAARDLAITCPETWIVHDITDLDTIAAKAVFPLVIKVRNSSGSAGVDYASSPEQLRATFSAMVKKFRLENRELPIIQEYVRGEGYGVSMLFNNGELRAQCTHRRLREYPVSGGSSTLRESVHHPAMERIARELLGHYQWHGLAMVEFKLRESDKKPVLMEINPRMWGSINLSILAGVDFPLLLYTMAVEGDVKPVLHHATGVCSRNLLSDIVAGCSYLMHTGTIRNLGAAPLFPLNDDIISADDPVPLFRFLRTGAEYLLKRM
jgi:predicted ATP-grasp superfamily ATP-dependent carboligase